jgi:hypothetical protein
MTTLNGGESYGMLVENTNHYTEGTLRPESIKVKNCSFVGHNIGLYHQDGLFCKYDNLDLDMCKKEGAIFYSVDGGCSFKDSWLNLKGSTASLGIEIRASVGGTTKKLEIDGINITVTGTIAAGAKGIAIGNTAADYYRKGVSITNCKIYGYSQLVNGIYSSRSSNLVCSDNFIDLASTTGDAIYAEYADGLVCERNECTNINITVYSPKVAIARDNVAAVTVNGTGNAEITSAGNVQIYNKTFEMFSPDVDSNNYLHYFKIGNAFIWTYLTDVYIKHTTAPTSATDGQKITTSA